MFEKIIGAIIGVMAWVVAIAGVPVTMFLGPFAGLLMLLTAGVFAAFAVVTWNGAQ